MISNDFDPNGVGIKGTLFGLPVDESQAAVIILSVPWEVTVSYGSGTSNAPAAILKASAQLDLADPNFHQAMLEVENDTKEPGTIVQEIQKGYMMKDRLLRPSLVGVAKKIEEKKEKK